MFLIWSSEEPEKLPTRRTARMGKMYRPKCRTTGTESIHSASESVASSTSSGVHSAGKSFNIDSTFAICYRPSVCRLSVTFMRPTQAVKIFGNISTALSTLAIPGHPLKILRRSCQGNPSAGRVKDKRGSQI